MKVLNPIYDSVFKYLMEDIAIAKGLISLIIEQEITELYPAPQESTSLKLQLKYNQLPLQRIDYVAIIKTPTVENPEYYEKVIIEVQKSPFIPEIGRFRNYLAEKYSKQSTYKIKNNQVEEYLPIKTIYIIDKDFNSELPVILRRKGVYYDVLSEKVYEGNRDVYVELLNHDSWFIQVTRLPKDLKTELLRVLSIFAPWLRDADDSFINVEDNDLLEKKYKLYRKILLRLKAAKSQNKLLLALETERKIEKEIEDNLQKAELYKQQAEAERQLKEEANEKADAERQLKEEANKKADAERQLKEEANKKAEEKEQKIINIVKKQHQKGMTILEIAEDLVLSENEVLEIIEKS